MECIEKILKKDWIDPTNGKKFTERDIVPLQRVSTSILLSTTFFKNVIICYTFNIINGYTFNIINRYTPNIINHYACNIINCYSFNIITNRDTSNLSLYSPLVIYRYIVHKSTININAFVLNSRFNISNAWYLICRVPPDSLVLVSFSKPRGREQWCRLDFHQTCCDEMTVEKSSCWSWTLVMWKQFIVCDYYYENSLI